jgi:hypothetical protein
MKSKCTIITKTSNHTHYILREKQLISSDQKQVHWERSEIKFVNTEKVKNMALCELA